MAEVGLGLARAHRSAAPCSEPTGEGRSAMQCSTWMTSLWYSCSSGGGTSMWPAARLAAFSRAIVSAAMTALRLVIAACQHHLHLAQGEAINPKSYDKPGLLGL